MAWSADVCLNWSLFALVKEDKQRPPRQTSASHAIYIGKCLDSTIGIFMGCNVIVVVLTMLCWSEYNSTLPMYFIVLLHVYM